jgi:periodic tryptophan protein 1
VYDRQTGNLYVHHDIPLPAFPLCLAHGQVSSQGKTGNFCAVGTFHPGIEIWNLDVLNALEPSCVLGGEDTTAADDFMQAQAMRGSSSSATKKPKTRNSGLRPGSHTDAVMALSWNPIHQQVIASGSADTTVKLWDVTKAGSGDQDGCNAATFSHHKDKVQSVSWHPVEGTLLATGSYDRTVALLDARGTGKDVKTIKLPADCEAIAWDIHNPEYLTVASEDGTLACYDVRQFDTSKPLWSFVANQFGISDISYNQLVPGFFAISSPDKTVTLWDAGVSGTSSAMQQPRCCGSKDMCSGKLYTIQFYPSDPWLLGTGGSGNQLALWDFSNEAEVQKRFAGRLANQSVEDVIAPLADTAETKPDEAELQSLVAKRESGAIEVSKGMHKKGGKAKGKSSNKVHRKGK